MSQPTLLALIQATHDQVLHMSGGGVCREVKEHGLVHITLQLVTEEVLQIKENYSDRSTKNLQKVTLN